MDFNYKKISHILALLIVLGAFFLIVISPILTFVGVFPASTITTRSQIFDKLEFDDYVSDVDHKDSEIEWGFVGNIDLTVKIDERIGSVVPPRNWNGSETITYIATDPDGLANAVDVTYSLNDGYNPTFLTNLENQIIQIGEEFIDINLDSYVLRAADPSIYNWSYSENTYLTITIENDIAKITYPADWSGVETVVFTATSPEGKTSSDHVTFIVNNGSAYPIISAIENQEKEYTPISEFVLIFGSLIAIALFVITPLIWYVLVNDFNKKQIFIALKLRIERLDDALLRGIATAVFMIIFVAIIGSILYSMGINEENLSNVSELAENLSLIGMLFIILFQSIGEEIFFRGFLLEKLESYAGATVAILISSVLFGLAHLSYGKIYPAVMPMVMGVLLGYAVIKTKNLYAAIIAHMLFNLTSFILYLFAQSLGS